MGKRSLFFLGLLVCSITLFVPAANARTPAGEFRIAVATLETEAFTPEMGTIDCKWYQTLLFDSLVGIEPPSTELSSKTGIATRWTHSPDYKTWTFHLRRGIQFHNGDELTAEDVKYTLERILGPVGMSVNKATLAETIDKVEVVDPATVRIQCKKPDSLLPVSLSENIGTEGMIVPKKYIVEKGDQYFRAHPIGTGPCKLAEHVPGKHILFETVDKHWALGVPRYKYVRISIVPETMARIGLLQRGEVDMILLPRERVAEVRNLGFPIVEDPSQGVNLLLMTETWKKEHPTSDLRVRKAMNISIDRKAILQTLFGGIGTLAPYSFATRAALGYEPADPPYPFDPEGAKALLREAGYGPAKPCPILVYSFPSVAFAEGEHSIEVIASYWTQVGFKVNIVKTPEWGMVKKKLKDRETEGGLYPNNIGGRVWSIPIINALNHGDVTYSHAKIPSLDEGIDKALSENDPEKRKALAHKVFHTMYENYLHIPLVEAPGTFALNPKTVPDHKEWKMGVTHFDFNLEWAIFR
jgi:peptide/nickel transport system substrate-binding protein